MPSRCWCPAVRRPSICCSSREHDALRESWDGAWAGTDGAVDRYGADDAFPIADIDEILPGLMEQRSRIFYSMGTHLDFDPRMLGWVTRLARACAAQAPGRCRSS